MLRGKKPDRNSPILEVDMFDEDPFNDRRLSDLLPTEIVRQIGFDPNCLLFPRSFPMQRRKTDPIVLSASDQMPVQRRATITETHCHPQQQFQSPLVDAQYWFHVELNDATVNCFSTFVINSKASDGVIVRDGSYLRLGRIIKQLRNYRSGQIALQIVGVDKDGVLCDYVNGQTQVAGALIPSFFARAECPVRFVGVETVSYQARALFRVRVRNVDAPNLDKVVRQLIQMFSIAVEIYD